MKFLTLAFLALTSTFAMAAEQTILSCNSREQVGEGTSYKNKLEQTYEITLERKNPIARYSNGSFLSANYGLVAFENTLEDKAKEIEFSKTIELDGKDTGAKLRFEIKRESSRQDGETYSVVTRVCQKEGLFKDAFRNNCANYDCVIGNK